MLSLQYFDMLQRSGLSVATDYVNFMFFHKYSLLEFIVTDEDLESQFSKTSNQKSVYVI